MTQEITNEAIHDLSLQISEVLIEWGQKHRPNPQLFCLALGRVTNVFIETAKAPILAITVANELLNTGLDNFLEEAEERRANHPA